jgi:hypothetical protein
LGSIPLGRSEQAGHVTTHLRPDLEGSTDRFSAVVPRTIDHELDIVRAAIAMVAVGASGRVVVASLRFGDEILPRAQALAGLRGLRVVPLWTMDDGHHSIAIERRDG